MSSDASRLEASFDAALERADAAEREAFLIETCAGDPEFLAKLRGLLGAHEAAQTILTPNDPPGLEAGTTAANAMPRESPGTMIGRYKLLQEIGEGGFGIVYLADQTAPVKRRVALKVLKPGMDTREVVARFEAERQALALMDHPNIARVFDGGATESGRPYFVMELVKGIPLTKYCDDHQLTTRQRLELFLDVLAAVQHAHQKGIIHRDLKPSNILVSPHDGTPVIKVIDFGIAKAISLELTEKTLFTGYGQMIGTPQYMSPEQAEINALDVDTRSDLYSLGVVLYELLTGRTPLDAKVLREAAYAEIQRLIREEEPPKPSTRISTLGDALPDVARHRGAEPVKLAKQVRGDLDWIVMKALEKDRARRYETANAFAADLRRHLENQPVVARPPGVVYLLSRFARRHKFGFAAGAAVTAALLAGIAATTWGLVREAAARRTAESATTKANAANTANEQNLHRASMADYASAVKALDEDFAATRNGQRATGFAGNSRWHEGVVLLTRSLERDAENTAATLRLYETLRSRHAGKRDWPLHTLKHDGALRHASFSPDGTRIVAASDDKTARVWDAAAGQPLGDPLRHETSVASASFSPDGTRILTASDDDTVRIWDAPTGQAIGEPMRHEGGLVSANFSPDGTRVVTATGPGGGIDPAYARMWDAATGRAIGDAMRHENMVESASFSPDGTRILTASDDGTARLWDAVTGQARGEPIGHGGENRASFSPDGTRIVTTSGDKTAQVWDAATGQALGDPLRHEDYVNSASFSPDGSMILTASRDNTARVWEAATGQALGVPMRHEGSVNHASFSSDGTRVVTASGSFAHGRAEMWNAATGEAIGEPMRHENLVDSASFSPDGARIVTTSGDSVARVWDAATTQAMGEPIRFKGIVSSARFNPDGTRIVTASDYDIARVWDAATGQAIGEPMRHEGGLESARFSPDGIRILTENGFRGDWNHSTARIWDAATGQALGEPIRVDEHVVVLSAGFSPDGTKIVTTSVTVSGAVARIWDAASGQALGEPVRREGFASNARFSPDGTRILTTTDDDTAEIWDAATGQAVGEPLPHEINNVFNQFSPGFSPDGTRVVTASNHNTAGIWDAATGHAIGMPMHHEGGVSSASFSPDGTKVVTTSAGTARVWDAATGRAIGKPMRHEGWVVKCPNFSPDGTRIVTASADKTARVWDAATSQALGEPMRHEGSVWSASFSPDGMRVLTTENGDHTNTARIWWILTNRESELIPVITPEILAWARNVSGMRFSEDGELEVISDAERIAGITTAVLPPGPWADLAKWINTPAPQRTLDPKSKVTPRQIAERERDFNGTGTVESLESALRYDPTVPLARLFLAAALEQADAAEEAKDREASIPQRAAFLRRYDLDALAREAGRMENDDLAALWVRAANHLLDLPSETNVGIGPKPTTSREEAANAARKALDLVPGMPAAEEVLKRAESAATGK